MKRVILVLSVAAVMVAMVLATTAPAFAKSEKQEGFFRCIAEGEALGYSTGESARQCAPTGRA